MRSIGRLGATIAIPKKSRSRALLHDVAEILLISFAPQEAMQVYAMLQAYRNLRSVVAQEKVLGFRVMDLQLACADNGNCPIYY